MIESVLTDYTTMDAAETTLTTESYSDTPKKRSGSLDSSSLRNTSLLLDDSDEEDDEEIKVLSRNPSLIEEGLVAETEDRDMEDGKHDGETLHTEQGNHPIQCEPTIIPMCQDGLPALIPGCQGNSLAEQFDMMTKCGHPMDFFPFFFEHDHPHQGEPSERFLPGMYALPRTCEYCGAMDLKLCSGQCQRPKSFFRRKRPPFSPPHDDQWDPNTGNELHTNTNTYDNQKSMSEPTRLERESSLTLRDFFR